MYSFLYAVNLRRVGLDVEYRRSVKGIKAPHDEPGAVNAENIYYCKSNRVRAVGRATKMPAKDSASIGMRTYG
jgi:hypothetical protein